MRKYVSQRLLALIEREIAAFTTSMRQIGVGTPSGALTASQSRPAVPRRSAALDMCVASSIERQLAEMVHRRHSIVNSHYSKELWRIEATGYSLPPACVDCGRATTSNHHSNASVRGRHRLQPKRAASVSEIFPSSQVETRNPNCSLATVGGHGAHSSPESFSAGRVALRRHHRQSPAALGDMSPLLTMGLATTTSTTLRLTQQFLTLMSPIAWFASVRVGGVVGHGSSTQ